MEQRRIDKIEKIQRKLEAYIKKDVLNLFAITGKLGVETGTKKRFWEKAKKAAETGKAQRDDKDIWWVPILWQEEIILVCGLKGYKKIPKDEINLLNGLTEEITYEDFLETQQQKIIDPKSEFIRDLLETEKIKTFEEAIDKGDILGINLRAPQAVILIEVPGFRKRIHDKHCRTAGEKCIAGMAEECQKLISGLSAAFNNYDQNIFACLESDLLVCLKWAKGEVNTLNTVKFFREKAIYIKGVIEKETKITPTIGVGQYYPGLKGLKKSYKDAKTALEIGRKIWGEGKIYHIVDVGMFIAVSSDISYERKCELSFQILGPIFSDKDLYKTVNVFLENDMNLSKSSKVLHLHRNTLIYRLEKIKKIVGLDPRKFSDAIQIKLGLMLYSPEEKC